MKVFNEIGAIDMRDRSPFFFSHPFDGASFSCLGGDLALDQSRIQHISVDVRLGLVVTIA